jgi:hypothetical protein
MVEPFAWSIGMANANWPILSRYHPHNGLAKGADEGVLLILLIGGDINLFSELIFLFYFLPPSNLIAPKMMKLRIPPRSPLVAPHVPSFLRRAWVFLFWLLFVSSSFGGRLRPQCFLFSLFFCQSI